MKKLAIETDFSHHSGVYGHTGNKYGTISWTPYEILLQLFCRTLFFINQLSPTLREKLLKMYRIDFELFGYDWKKYFHTWHYFAVLHCHCTLTELSLCCVCLTCYCFFLLSSLDYDHFDTRTHKANCVREAFKKSKKVFFTP